MNAIRAVVAVLAVLVVGLVIAFVVTASGQSSNNDDRTADIIALQAQVNQAKAAAKAAGVKAESAGTTEVSRLKTDIATAQSDVDALQTRNRVLERKLKLVTDCVPEMQQEMNSLEVSRYGYISMTSQVSRVCSALLYPDSRSGE